MSFIIFSSLLAMLGISSCAEQKNQQSMIQESVTYNSKLDTAIFANGCFWCTEAVFQRVEGVVKVISGYGGGHVLNPTYEQVCDKNTGHAECCKILFDPTKVTYDELLEIFWKTHDPTTKINKGMIRARNTEVLYFT